MNKYTAPTLKSLLTSEINFFIIREWNINRWYDFNIGRWVSEYPIGFEAADGNFYRYTRNIPITFVDQFGKRDFIQGLQGEKLTDAEIKPGNLAPGSECKTGFHSIREHRRDMYEWRHVKTITASIFGTERSFLGIYQAAYLYNGDFIIQRRVVTPAIRCSCFRFERRPSMSAYANLESYYFIYAKQEYTSVRVIFTGDKIPYEGNGPSAEGVIQAAGLIITVLTPFY
jgi:hypothetical protein